MRRFLCCIAFFAAAWTASASELLYSIGGTGFGQPVRVTTIDPNTTTATRLFDLESDNGSSSGLISNSSHDSFYGIISGRSGSSSVNSSASGGLVRASFAVWAGRRLATGEVSPRHGERLPTILKGKEQCRSI